MEEEKRVREVLANSSQPCMVLTKNGSVFKCRFTGLICLGNLKPDIIGVLYASLFLVVFVLFVLFC